MAPEQRQRREGVVDPAPAKRAMQAKPRGLSKIASRISMGIGGDRQAKSEAHRRREAATAGRGKMHHAVGKMAIINAFKPARQHPSAMATLSSRLQRELNDSVDLYAQDATQLLSVFWTQPALAKRMVALHELGWLVYLCGEPLRSQLGSLGKQSVLREASKLLLSMSHRPVHEFTKNLALQSLVWFCIESPSNQAVCVAAGVQFAACDFLEDPSFAVRACASQLIRVLSVGSAQALEAAARMPGLRVKLLVSYSDGCEDAGLVLQLLDSYAPIKMDGDYVGSYLAYCKFPPATSSAADRHKLLIIHWLAGYGSTRRSGRPGSAGQLQTPSADSHAVGPGGQEGRIA